IDFFVDVLLGVQRARAGHFDDVATPFAFGAMKLDVGAASAGALPRSERQVLNLADADVAEDRNALRLHEVVVGRLRAAELAEARAFAAGRLVPMGGAWNVMHVLSPLGRPSTARQYRPLPRRKLCPSSTSDRSWRARPRTACGSRGSRRDSRPD